MQLDLLFFFLDFLFGSFAKKAVPFVMSFAGTLFFF